jgi:hypothetical protein
MAVCEWVLVVVYIFSVDVEESCNGGPGHGAFHLRKNEFRYSLLGTS